MPKRARRTGGQLGGRHCPLHDFSSSSGVTSRSYCIVCVYIYIYVCICMYAHPSTIQHIAWSGTKRRVDPTTSHHPLSLVSAPFFSFFFIWYPVGGLCVSPLLAFSTLFSRLADSFPLNRIHRNHIGRLIFNGPQNVWNSFCYLFSLSLSLFPPSLSSCRTKRNLSHSLSFSRRRFCPRDGSPRTWFCFPRSVSIVEKDILRDTKSSYSH